MSYGMRKRCFNFAWCGVGLWLFCVASSSLSLQLMGFTHTYRDKNLSDVRVYTLEGWNSTLRARKTLVPRHLFKHHVTLRHRSDFMIRLLALPYFPSLLYNGAYFILS